MCYNVLLCSARLKCLGSQISYLTRMAKASHLEAWYICTLCPKQTGMLPDTVKKMLGCSVIKKSLTGISQKHAKLS